MRMAMKKQDSFTLVELLVVIAVISILAAIFLPAIRTAMEASRCAKCANNIKQIHVATVLYADEHNGYLPWGEEGWSGAWGPMRLISGGKYMDTPPWPMNWKKVKAKDLGLFLCPDYTNVGGNKHFPTPQRGIGFTDGFSYYTKSGRIRLSRAKLPSYTILYADARPPGPYDFEDAGMPCWSRRLMGHGNGIAPRHYSSSEPGNEFANFIFWDGHVSKHHKSDMCDEGWPNTYAAIHPPSADPMRWVGDGYIGWHSNIQDGKDPFKDIKRHRELLWW